MSKPPLLILVCEGKAIRNNFIILCEKGFIRYRTNLPSIMHWIHSRESNCIFTAKHLNLQERSPYQHLKFIVLQQPIEQY